MVTCILCLWEIERKLSAFRFNVCEMKWSGKKRWWGGFFWWLREILWIREEILIGKLVWWGLWWENWPDWIFDKWLDDCLAVLGDLIFDMISFEWFFDFIWLENWHDFIWMISFLTRFHLIRKLTWFHLISFLISFD